MKFEPKGESRFEYAPLSNILLLARGKVPAWLIDATRGIRGAMCPRVVAIHLYTIIENSLAALG